MLQDNHNRVISYLRISVTDRCNFRCVYCMPETGVELAPRDEILSFEEIARVANVGATLGLTKIRITGGEPTVRRDLPGLIQMLRAIPGISEIAMTTNAARLEELAQPLKDAGMTRLNISLDTLQREKFIKLARRDFYDATMRGVETAARIFPLKFNAVAMRGVNDDELGDLVRFAHGHDAPMRFIEYMPMGAARFDSQSKFIGENEMREILSREFDLESTPEYGRTFDPASPWICRQSGARVGFISSMSDHFCASCNRMRLTAQGGLRPCLHQNSETDVRQILRGGGSDEGIADAFRAAADSKWAGHRMNDFIPLFSAKDMVSLGG